MQRWKRKRVPKKRMRNKLVIHIGHPFFKPPSVNEKDCSKYEAGLPYPVDTIVRRRRKTFFL